MDYQDIKKGFRKQVAEIVTNYDLLKDMVENTDPMSEELLEQWVK